MSKIKKGGRPVNPIDWGQVERMLKAGSSGGAVADFLGMNRDHFYRRVLQEKKVPLSQWQAQCKAFYRQSLRVAQLKEALGHVVENTETIYEDRPDGSRVPIRQTITTYHRPPNAALLIFLGKNMLDQRDKPEPGGSSSLFGNIPNYRLVGDDEGPE